MLSSLCFAQAYYAEYSFAEAVKIGYDELNDYEFISHWTKTEIQEKINRDKISTSTDSSGRYRLRTLADYMSKMLRANTDKRIFFIDLSIQYRPYGWLFIKINDNEYLSFFTGS